MVMSASSAVICGLHTTWRTTSRKRSSNHPGQVPVNQRQYSPDNSESKKRLHRLLAVRGTQIRADESGTLCGGSGSVFYLLYDVSGFCPVHFEVSGGHDH